MELQREIKTKTKMFRVDFAVDAPDRNTLAFECDGEGYAYIDSTRRPEQFIFENVLSGIYDDNPAGNNRDRNGR